MLIAMPTSCMTIPLIRYILSYSAVSGLVLGRWYSVALHLRLIFENTIFKNRSLAVNFFPRLWRPSENVKPYTCSYFYLTLAIESMGILYRGTALFLLGNCTPNHSVGYLYVVQDDLSPLPKITKFGANWFRRRFVHFKLSTSAS